MAASRAARRAGRGETGYSSGRSTSQYHPARGKKEELTHPPPSCWHRMTQSARSSAPISFRRSLPMSAMLISPQYTPDMRRCCGSRRHENVTRRVKERARVCAHACERGGGTKRASSRRDGLTPRNTSLARARRNYHAVGLSRSRKMERVCHDCLVAKQSSKHVAGKGKTVKRPRRKSAWRQTRAVLRRSDGRVQSPKRKRRKQNKTRTPPARGFRTPRRWKSWSCSAGRCHSRPVRLRSANGFQNRDIRGRQNGFPESRQSWPSGGSGVRAGTEHSSSAAQGIAIAPSVRCALLIGVRVLSQQQQQ